MTLTEQLDDWYEEDEFEKMVEAIEGIPREEWDYEIVHYLACAWNNLDEYEKAMEVLQERIEEKDRENRWYYKMGYALFYLDRIEEALEAFRKSLEFCPDDEDVLEYIEDCENILADGDRDPEEDGEDEGEDDEESSGGFLGFILLSSAEWDKEKLKKDMKDDWNIIVEEAEAEAEEKEKLLFSMVEGGILVTALMEMQVPDGEAEWAAERNYMWPDAVEAAKKHKAHLMVTVMGDGDIIEKGILFVKLASCCCKQKHTLGIYVNRTLIQPDLYIGFAEMIKGDDLPIFNWVWFGLYSGENGMCGYTEGLKVFGKDEIEVLDTDLEPRELQEFLMDVTVYVISEDVVLQDGETIGFTEEQKLSITCSEGVAVDGMSLKIDVNRQNY